jgi:EmrB/QacA subfamily drug resistance transporter
MNRIGGTSEAAGPAYDSRRWLGLAVLLLAAAIDLIDVTVVNIALPAIRDDLGASAAQLEWIIAGYTLAFALTLITGGRLGDVHGRRRMFLVGVAGFTLASLACGLAWSAEALVAARVVQGAFAGLMVPQVLSTINVSFPSEERPKAYGLYGAVAGIATVSGPLVAGLLVQGDLFGLDWRPIFLINLPVGLVTFAAALAFVCESRESDAPRLDLAGVGLVTAALLLLLFPLVQGHEQGWPAWMFVSMAASVPVLALFAVQQARRARSGDAPLVPPVLFSKRAFTGGVLAALTFFSGIAGFFLVLTLTLQAGLEFSPLHTALTYLPWSLGIAVAAGASVNLAPRLGRRLTVAGALTMAAGMGALLAAVEHAGDELSSWWLLPGLLLSGLAMGMVAPTLVDVTLAGVHGRDAGSASGVLNTAMQLGGAIGVALIGVVYFGALDEQGFVGALDEALWFQVGVFLLSALAMLLLPRRASAGRDEAVVHAAPAAAESR